MAFGQRLEEDATGLRVTESKVLNSVRRGYTDFLMRLNVLISSLVPIFKLGDI